jgi:Flp pilus assembly pilin Flp
MAFLNYTSPFYLICWPFILFRHGNQIRSIGEVFTEENRPSVTILLEPRALEMTMFGQNPSERGPWQHGQGMLEYALIVFLIAVVAILGIVFLVPVILQGLSGALPAL